MYSSLLQSVDSQYLWEDLTIGSLSSFLVAGVRRGRKVVVQATSNDVPLSALCRYHQVSGFGLTMSPVENKQSDHQSSLYCSS